MDQYPDERLSQTPDWGHGIALPADGFLWICTVHNSLGFEHSEDGACHHLSIHEDGWVEPACGQLSSELIHALSIGDSCDEHDWDLIYSIIDCAQDRPEFENLPYDFWSVNGPDGSPSCGAVRSLIDRLLVPVCDSHIIYVPAAMHALAHRTDEVARLVKRGYLPIVAANAVANDMGGVSWIGEQLAEEFSEWMAGQ